MPLLLLDLDNTIIDRAIALRSWAVDFLTERGADPQLLEEMVRADGDGLRPKPEVALHLQSLLGLDGQETATIVAVLRQGVLDHLSVAPEVVEALDRASAAGWTPFVVTDGVVPQRDSKITRLELDAHLAGWVVSDVVGVRKPAPRIFAIASTQAGQFLEGSWMVGDAHGTDIEGAPAAGIRSIYVSWGRQWPEGQPEPTVFADSFVTALEIVLRS